MTKASEAFAVLQQLGLEPLLRVAQERFRRNDGARGRVSIALERTAREHLANLTGRAYSGEVLHVDLAGLDESLRNSRFQTDLKAVLEAGYGPLRTRRQARADAEYHWLTWLEQNRITLPPTAHDWFTAICAGESPSGRWVRRTYNAEPTEAAQVIQTVGQALSQLPVVQSQITNAQNGHELLAVFAAQVTGDPHAFDAGTPAGSLLLHALAERYPTPDEGLRESERRALLLDRAGLGVDQVSSSVLVAHLAGATTTAGLHPVVEAMRTHGGAWSLTLGEIRRWAGARATRGRAYVVENPPVFEYLLRRLESLPPTACPTLICTGGFLSAAAVRLLDLLAQSGTKLWYGGDFDRNGLTIATWLAERYRDWWCTWRMAPSDYRLAAANMGRPLSPEDRQYLENMSGPLSETAQVVAQGGVAYQERLVESLHNDLLDQFDQFL